MDFLDIIGTVIEFSQKGEEYSDEIKSIKATLESLQLTVQCLGSNKLPGHISSMLDENLGEAKDLIKKATEGSGSWWANFKNMLPGSLLQKIKEKNQQLVHIINLVNLHLNSMGNSKRSLQTALTTNFDDIEEPRKLKKMNTMSGQSSRNEFVNPPRKSASGTHLDSLMGPTIPEEEENPSNVIDGPTLPDNQDENMTNEDVAYKLRIIYDERLGKLLKSCKDFIPIIEGTWQNEQIAKYNFQRLNYAYLPVEDATKISRDHAIFTAVRKALKKSPISKENLNVAATVPDEATDSNLFGPTMADDGETAPMESEDNKEKDEFILKDLSLNGTYYLKGVNPINFPAAGIKFQGDFKHLPKDAEINLEHGDIIGLIVQKPQCKSLIFGFQLLLE